MFQNIALPLHPQIAKQGALTKRLCGGLQNRIEQFDSATHLQNPQAVSQKLADFFFSKVSSVAFQSIIRRPSKYHPLSLKVSSVGMDVILKTFNL